MVKMEVLFHFFKVFLIYFYPKIYNVEVRIKNNIGLNDRLEDKPIDKMPCLKIILQKC